MICLYSVFSLCYLTFPQVLPAGVKTVVAVCLRALLLLPRAHHLLCLTTTAIQFVSLFLRKNTFTRTFLHVLPITSKLLLNYVHNCGQSTETISMLFESTAHLWVQNLYIRKYSEWRVLLHVCTWGEGGL